MMVGNPTPRPYWTPDAPVVRLTEQECTSYREQCRELLGRCKSDLTLALPGSSSDEGLMTDKYEMSATLSGVRTGDKADEILRRSLDILHRYQMRMGSCGEP